MLGYWWRCDSNAGLTREGMSAGIHISICRKNWNIYQQMSTELSVDTEETLEQILLNIYDNIYSAKSL